MKMDGEHSCSAHESVGDEVTGKKSHKSWPNRDDRKLVGYC